jgi:hypothetical protein
VVARSWIALGARLDGRAVGHVVDIEALIVATARLEELVDARVREEAVAWCVRFGWAVSGARLTRVAQEMQASEATARFAAGVAEAGGMRWPVVSAASVTSATPVPAPRIPGSVEVADLEAPARLAWRLRAAFGTTSRADVLLVLMRAPAPIGLGEVARAARYTKGAVAATMACLALAGLVEAVRVGRADRVSLRPGSIVAAWQPADGHGMFDAVTTWHVCLQALATLDATADLGYGDAAVAQRACAERLVNAMITAGLPMPNLKVRGPVFTVEFDRWAGALADSWVEPDV